MLEHTAPCIRTGSCPQIACSSAENANRSMIRSQIYKCRDVGKMQGLYGSREKLPTQVEELKQLIGQKMRFRRCICSNGCELARAGAGAWGRKQGTSQAEEAIFTTFQGVTGAVSHSLWLLGKYRVSTERKQDVGTASVVSQYESF